jgi:hypothetical protein
MTVKTKSKSSEKSKTLIASAILVPIVLGILASPLLPKLMDHLAAKNPPAETPSPAIPAAVANKEGKEGKEAPATVSSETATAEEGCLKKAWETFKAAKYESAITFSQQCIDQFGKAADRAQKALDDAKVPPPPTAKFTNAQKTEILDRGLLNDVAAAYFIKGQAAEYLYRKGGPTAAANKTTAEEAYEATCRYKHGRVWDTGGWFWSPCEAAADRLPIK